MENYKPNSHAYKEGKVDPEKREKRAEKAIVGSAKTKKKSVGKKLSNALVSEDAGNVKSYILMDVIVPAAKKLISDIVRDGIDMLLYGESGRDRKDSRRTGASYVQYSSYSRRDDRDRPRERERYSNRFDYDEITFETRRDAETVLIRMKEIIREYGIVRILDLYDLADLTPPYTAGNYGWTSLTNATITRLRDGSYYIDLPRACPID